MPVTIRKRMINSLNPEHVERYTIIADVNGVRAEVSEDIGSEPEPEGGPTNREKAAAACEAQLAAME